MVLKHLISKWNKGVKTKLEQTRTQAKRNLNQNLEKLQRNPPMSQKRYELDENQTAFE